MPVTASPFVHPIQNLASDVVDLTPASTKPSPLPEPPEPYLAANVISKLNRTILAAWAPNTLEKYRLGVARFVYFCAEQRVASEFQLPASKFLLCAFAASSAAFAWVQ